MRILIRKFGTTLVSRPAGKEAYLAFQPTLQSLGGGEAIIVDFEKIIALTPSWADEFLTPLMKKYKGRVKLENTSNFSVIETLKILNLAP